MKLLQSAIVAEPNALRHKIALGHPLAGEQGDAAAAGAYGDALKIDMTWPGLVSAYALSCYRACNFKEAELAARQMLKAEQTAKGWDTLSCALRAQARLRTRFRRPRKA